MRHFAYYGNLDNSTTSLFGKLDVYSVQVNLGTVSMEDMESRVRVDAKGMSSALDLSGVYGTSRQVILTEDSSSEKLHAAVDLIKELLERLLELSQTHLDEDNMDLSESTLKDAETASEILDQLCKWYGSACVKENARRKQLQSRIDTLRNSGGSLKFDGIME